MESGFLIAKISPIRSKSNCSHLTYEWKLPDGKQITIYYRKKGSQFGGHFHKGEDPSKNPEMVFVARGKLRLNFIDRDGKKTKRILHPGEVLTVYPYVKHFCEALEDVILVEFRVTHFDKNHPDTYPC